jgi:hypothetical protein
MTSTREENCNTSFSDWPYIDYRRFSHWTGGAQLVMCLCCVGDRWWSWWWLRRQLERRLKRNCLRNISFSPPNGVMDRRGFVSDQLISITLPLDGWFWWFQASNSHKLTHSNDITTFQLVSWTFGCTVMAESTQFNQEVLQEPKIASLPKMYLVDMIWNNYRAPNNY